MCTVSWIHGDSGYQLFCNRDEKHTRQPALPPRIRQQRGVRFISPLDRDQGGSWIGVNQFGLSLCLLNRYSDEADSSNPAFNYTSRGLLLIELIDSRSRTETQERIGKMGLARYRPFTLLALEPKQTALIIHWTGRERLIESNVDRAMPLISSSHDPIGVSSARQGLFTSLLMESGKVDDNLLEKFHRSHSPTASAYSTCMHRDDARTVSFSKVNVSRDKIGFSYHGDSPCVDARNADNCMIILPL